VKSGMAKGERIALGEVAEINPPIPRAAVDDPGMEVSFVGMSGVSEVTASVLEHDVRTVAECRKGYTAFQRGDVLVAKITPCFENGKIVMADIPHAFGFGSTEFHVIRPRPDKLDPRFLLHFLRVPFFRIQGERRMTGSAGQRRVPANFLSTFDIPLPPLLLQRRIAEVLDKAEALRAKRRAALAQLDSLTQSLFLDLFGDPAINPKKWPKASLNDCTEKIQIGPFGSLLHQEDYVADGIPLVNPKHIQSGAIATNHWESVTQRKYAQLETYHLRQGDIVMGRRGEMGRCAIVSGNEPLLCGTGSLIIRPDNKRTSALFLCAILSTQQMKEAFERLSLGQTLPNLNSGIVGKFMLPLPPLDLQHEFARRVAAVEKLKTAQRAALAELDALFASLQHRAFRGEL
jgi:type I restriction enzyme S subunit